MIAFNIMIKLSKTSSDSNHLKFDLRNNKLNLVEMDVNLNNDKNNSLLLTNDYYNNKQQQHQVKKPKKILKFDEISNKLKQDALIDVFKLKLLELLDLDEAPSPSDFNINKNPVPEPIMREYNKLLKMSQQQQQQQHHHHQDNNKHASSAMYSRRIRDKQVETPNNNNDIDHDHELIRFNSSVVQEVTLLPNRVKSKQDPTVLYFNSQNDWCSTNQSLFTLLSCFKFNLDQKEFLSNDLKSAEMYMKLDLNSIRQFLINKQSTLDEESLNELAFLYLEVNGNLLKRIHLLKDDESSYIEYVDLKQIMENLTSIMSEQRQTSLRVRLVTSSFLINSFLPLDQEEFKHIFSNLDELVALRIKFGDVKPKLNANNKLRNKRQQYLYSSSSDSKSNSRGGGGSSSRHRNGQSKQVTKNYRDCADLRKIGQTSSNFTCCRETISFSMDQIGWSHWILSPKVIEYKYCRGGCISKLSSLKLLFFLFLF